MPTRTSQIPRNRLYPLHLRLPHFAASFPCAHTTPTPSGPVIVQSTIAQLTTRNTSDRSPALVPLDPEAEKIHLGSATPEMSDAISPRANMESPGMREYARDRDRQVLVDGQSKQLIICACLVGSEQTCPSVGSTSNKDKTDCSVTRECLQTDTLDETSPTTTNKHGTDTRIANAR
jgi:hypothetical protein